MPRPASRKQSTSAELAIVTGLSGSGKATALRCLEDMGYRAVDNLPVDLIETFADLIVQARESRWTALGIDVREGTALERFPQILEKLQDKVRVRLLFLEAEDAVLIRRFSETRRPHPLGKARSLALYLKEERRRLAPIRALAEAKIDTSKLTAHELRRLIEEKFATRRKKSQLAISVISFGFRHGLPQDADLVFDVRFLPNPNYIPALRKKNGRDAPVARFRGVVSANRRVFGPRLEHVALPHPSLRDRGKELFDHCLRLHRRAPSIGFHRRQDSSASGKGRLRDSGRRSRLASRLLIRFSRLPH
jgi:UPF0042 nucleotide-binding protein